MGIKKTAEQRFFPRYHAVAPSFDGRMYLESDRSSLEGVVTDVSRDGLGALLDRRLSQGDHVILEVANKTLTFVVRHCQEDLIHRGKYRAGLQRIGAVKENVAQVFSALGYLA